MAEKLSRDLMRGSLDLMALSVLSEGAMYGYLLQKKLREASEGLVRLEAGTLYPLLHRLEAEGLIAARWEETTGRPRKWYELTTAGQGRLHEQAQEWRAYADCILRLLQTVDPPPATV